MINKKLFILLSASLLSLCGCDNNSNSTKPDGDLPTTTNDENNSTDENPTTGSTTEDSDKPLLEYYTIDTKNLEEHGFTDGTQFTISESQGDNNQNNVDNLIKYMNIGYPTQDLIKSLNPYKVQIGVYQTKDHTCLQLGSGKYDGSLSIELNYPIKKIEVGAANYSKQPYSYDHTSELEIGSSEDDKKTFDLSVSDNNVRHEVFSVEFESKVTNINLEANGYSKKGSASRVSLEFITFYF